MEQGKTTVRVEVDLRPAIRSLDALIGGLTRMRDRLQSEMDFQDFEVQRWQDPEPSPYAKMVPEEEQDA